MLFKHVYISEMSHSSHTFKSNHDMQTNMPPNTWHSSHYFPPECWDDQKTFKAGESAQKRQEVSRRLL